MKLDFGSGHNPRKGFKTSDITSSPFLDYVINPETYQVSCENNIFDEVLVRNVFHHIKNPDSLFKELSRITKPNGKIVIVDAREEYYRANVVLDVVWYRYIFSRQDIWICNQYRNIVKWAEKYFKVERITYHQEKQKIVLRGI